MESRKRYLVGLIMKPRISRKGQIVLRNPKLAKAVMKCIHNKEYTIERLLFKIKI
jgi:hypothetical protein